MRKIFKPAVVEVVRYFRNWDHNHNQIASNGGMTAIVELNYETNRMTFYPAFCMDCDNFSKEIGFAYAKVSQDNNLGFSIDLHRASSIRNHVWYSKNQGIAHNFQWTSAEAEEKFSAPLKNLVI